MGSYPALALLTIGDNRSDDSHSEFHPTFCRAIRSWSIGHDLDPKKYSFSFAAVSSYIVSVRPFSSWYSSVYCLL